MRHPRKQSRYLAIGTISEGTLRPEDLIPAYLDALRPVRMSRAGRTTLRRLQAEWYALPEDFENSSDVEQRELGDHILEDLQSLADDYAPPYCHVGSTDGDGAQIGVWPSVPDSFDDDVYRSHETPSDTPPRPRGYERSTWQHAPTPCSYWLHVNDHGNCTLYARIGRSWARYREIWSAV